MFSRGPSNFVVLFVILAIYFAPARGSSTNVGDHIKTSKDYKKVEHVRTWLRSSSLAKFQQIWSECFFSSFVQFNSYYSQDHLQLLYLGAVCSTGLLGLCQKWFFFVWNLQTFLPLKPMFWGNPSFFLTFVYINRGVLILHLHVVALPASVPLSRPAKTT